MIALKVKVANAWATIAGIVGPQGPQGDPGPQGIQGPQGVVGPNPLIVANRQISSYTLQLSDGDKLVEMNVGSANNLTVPLNASVAFPIGTQILIAQYGAGQTSILPTGGVNVRSAGGKLKLTERYSAATLIKIDTDEWYLFGDLSL